MNNVTHDVNKKKSAIITGRLPGPLGGLLLGYTRTTTAKKEIIINVNHTLCFCGGILYF